MKNVPIPDIMAHLPRDDRGLPVPVIVLRDREGRPHFTINDTVVTKRMLDEDRCAICGRRLHRGRWYVGGPLSAFHPNGSYLDTPLHHACMRYAMVACPHLGAPRYARRVEGKTLDLAANPHVHGFVDRTVIAERPSVFVAVMTLGHDFGSMSASGLPYLRPRRPYRNVEFWRMGERLTEAAGAAIAAKAVADAMEAQGVRA